MLKRLMIAVLVVACYPVFSQAPQSFNYQSLVRNELGFVVADSQIGVELAIVQGSADGDAVYVETFAPTTDPNGQLSVQVGTGTVQLGDFSTIAWNQGPFFVKTSIDVDGGSDYAIFKTSPLNSVPVALYANVTQGVPERTEYDRDEIPDPEVGQIIFCWDCGEFGEFQVFNGTEWVTAIGAPTSPGPILVQEINVSVLNYYDLDFDNGDNTLPLAAEILPGDAANQEVLWSSNDESIATIDANGVVTWLAFGTVILTATSADQGGASGSLEFEFLEEPPVDLVFEGIFLVGDSVIMADGQKQLIPFLLPTTDPDEDASWESSDDNIATVDEFGMVTGIAEGVVTITVTSSDGNAYQDAIEMTVIDDFFFQDIKYPVITIDGYDGVTTVQLQRSVDLQIPNATAVDTLDTGSALPLEVSPDFDLTYNANPFEGMTLEEHLLIYSATDEAGNERRDSVYIEIVDHVPPAIELTDGFANSDTIYTNNTLVVSFPTATAIDDNGDVIPVSFDDSNYQAALAGKYCVKYTAMDPQGNVRIDTLSIIVADSIPPTITLSDGSIDGDTLHLPQGVPFDLPIGTAIDDQGDPMNLAFDDNGFEYDILGCYNIIYASQDTIGNAMAISIVAKVSDIDPPMIHNKTELSIIASALGTETEYTPGEPTIIGTVDARDNVGIETYAIQSLEGGFENYEGEVEIDDEGNIICTSTDQLFEAPFLFQVHVTDSSGLQDSTFIEFHYVTGELGDIRMKEHRESSWNQIHHPWDGLVPYSYRLKEESAIGDSVLFMTAGVNPTILLDGFYFHPDDPGIGADDFTIQYDGDLSILTLVNPLNSDLQEYYTLNLLARVASAADPEVTFDTEVTLEIHVQSYIELMPTFTEIFPEPEPNLTIGDFLNAVDGFVGSVACPLEPANGILEGIADLQDQLVSALPIIPEDTVYAKAKEMLEKLPAYFWLRKDGDLTRINAKFTVQTKKVRIEYVIDPVNGGCYWGVILDQLKPSSIHSSLSALDNDTQGGVVVTTLTINDQFFDCITIPCMDLEPGAHVVVTGKPVEQESGGGGAAAIMDPSVFGVVTPLADGFSDPNLEYTFSLKADFRTEFEDELVERMNSLSGQAQLAISAARIAEDLAQDGFNFAAQQLGIDQALMDAHNLFIGPYQNTMSSLQGQRESAWNVMNGAWGELNAILGADQICSPNCVVPCVTVGWCTSWCCGWPCTSSCGCNLYGPQICVPNPVAEASAVVFSAAIFQPAQSTYNSVHSQWQQSIQAFSQLNSPQDALQAAITASTSNLAIAQNALGNATGALGQLDIDLGIIADIANYILDHGVNQTVATGQITFVGNLDDANNGQYTGQLIFDVSILTAPQITITFPEFTFNGDQIESVLDNVADVIIDNIN